MPSKAHLSGSPVSGMLKLRYNAWEKLVFSWYEFVLKKQASDGCVGLLVPVLCSSSGGATQIGCEGMLALGTALATLKQSDEGDVSRAHTFSRALKRSTPGPFFHTPSMAVSALASTA